MPNIDPLSKVREAKDLVWKLYIQIVTNQCYRSTSVFYALTSTSCALGALHEAGEDPHLSIFTKSDATVATQCVLEVASVLITLKELKAVLINISKFTPLNFDMEGLSSRLQEHAGKLVNFRVQMCSSSSIYSQNESCERSDFENIRSEINNLEHARANVATSSWNQGLFRPSHTATQRPSGNISPKTSTRTEVRPTENYAPHIPGQWTDNEFTYQNMQPNAGTGADENTLPHRYMRPYAETVIDSGIEVDSNPQDANRRDSGNFSMDEDGVPKATRTKNRPGNSSHHSHFSGHESRHDPFPERISPVSTHDHKSSQKKRSRRSSNSSHGSQSTCTPDTPVDIPFRKPQRYAHVNNQQKRPAREAQQHANAPNPEKKQTQPRKTNHPNHSSSPKKTPSSKPTTSDYINSRVASGKKDIKECFHPDYRRENRPGYDVKDYVKEKVHKTGTGLPSPPISPVLPFLGLPEDFVMEPPGGMPFTEQSNGAQLIDEKPPGLHGASSPILSTAATVNERPSVRPGYERALREEQEKLNAARARMASELGSGIYDWRKRFMEGVSGRVYS